MISNRDIDKLLGKLCPTSYKGCFSSDTLPAKPFDKLPASMVINLSKHTEKTGHFVAVYETNEAIGYLDPLGVPACLVPYYPQSVCQFLKRTNKSMQNSG